jgi:quercetin dioxygenase-like cupin family protein
MKVPLVNERDVPERSLPGRHLRWLINAETAGARHLSMCTIRVAPGECVRPAHSHPNGEEVIYIVRGSGRVLMDGEVAAVEEGSAVLFPQGSVHMLHNTGAEEMKVACFFAPPSNLDTYRFFESVEFPES